MPTRLQRHLAALVAARAARAPASNKCSGRACRFARSVAALRALAPLRLAMRNTWYVRLSLAAERRRGGVLGEYGGFVHVCCFSGRVSVAQFLVAMAPRRMQTHFALGSLAIFCEGDVVAPAFPTFFGACSSHNYWPGLMLAPCCSFLSSFCHDVLLPCRHRPKPSWARQLSLRYRLVTSVGSQIRFKLALHDNAH